MSTCSLVVGREIESEADNRILDAFAREIASSLALEELEAEASEAGALAAAGDLRTAILSAVSHDLRTPLSGIKASVTSLLQDDVEWTPAETSEFLVTIDEESDRLNSLVGNLLDMSRLQTGALDVSLTAVGLDEVIPGALASIGPRAADVDVDLDETHPRVLADPGLLERALANVIVNALNHSPNGARVRVVAGVAGDTVDVRVVDRGPGVPPADRDRVFLPFQRLGDAGGGEGVGLGLAVAKGFVEAIGGEVELEDTPGGGLDDGVPPQGGTMTRILVVDDEPQILRALGTNLKARGYEIDLAPTGEAALTLAARHHPDLVILDLGLPGIDGIEVIQGLRGWTQVPIVVLSVREGERDKVAALDAGADDYVTKPFGMDELLARLRAALRRAAPAEESAEVVTPDFTVDLAAKRVTNAAGRGAPDADGVGDRRDPRAQPRQADHAAPAAARGLGAAVLDRDELPARLHGADPAQARAGPVAAPLVPHRGADGVPLRSASGVTSSPATSRRNAKPASQGGFRMEPRGIEPLTFRAASRTLSQLSYGPRAAGL